MTGTDFCVNNPSRGIQTRNVVFKSGSWHSNSSRGGQIRLSGIQICLSFKVIIALDSIVGNCCSFSMCIVVIFHVHCCNCVYCCDLQCNCIMCVGHVTLDYISNRTAV